MGGAVTQTPTTVHGQTSYRARRAPTVADTRPRAEQPERAAPARGGSAILGAGFCSTRLAQYAPRPSATATTVRSNSRTSSANDQWFT